MTKVTRIAAALAAVTLDDLKAMTTGQRRRLSNECERVGFLIGDAERAVAGAAQRNADGPNTLKNAPE